MIFETMNFKEILLFSQMETHLGMENHLRGFCHDCRHCQCHGSGHGCGHSVLFREAPSLSASLPPENRGNPENPGGIAGRHPFRGLGLYRPEHHEPIDYQVI